MDSLATLATLDKYSAAFCKLARRYPECWHIVARADQRCRAEFWVEERRRLEEFHDTNPSMSTLDVLMPWEAVIKSSVTSLDGRDFWSREFTDLVNHFKNSGGQTIDPSSGAAQRANLRRAMGKGDGGGYDRGSKGDKGAGAGTGDKNRYGPAPKGPKGGKKGKKDTPYEKTSGKDSKRPDGRYFNDHHGKQLCFTWCRQADGCKKVCPNGRAHACEWCRGYHRSFNCKEAPKTAAGPVAADSGSG